MLVALGISGGIAAYKACEVVRGLDRAQVGVQVLMTANATEFITPLTLQTLSRRKVLLRTFDTDTEKTIQHIELTREIDALLVAPATANVLAKFAQGIADDLLTTFYVSVTGPVIVAPAMNTRMWEHPTTRDNLARLRSFGVEVVEPDSGWLAEGEVGWGRLAEPERIVEHTLGVLRRSRALSGKRVVISAGPTREAIDPVRFLSNRSSGKMGYALAEACAARGAEVVLVSGPVSLAPPAGVRCVRVTTANEMRDAMLAERTGADAVFMAAAVADFVPRPSATKIKKTRSGLDLEFDPAPDILATLGADRRERLLVGFAAETDDLLANAQGKLERKNLDFIVANDVSGSETGFESDDNEVTILGRAGQRFDVPRGSKRTVAEAILDRLFSAPVAEGVPG